MTSTGATEIVRHGYMPTFKVSNSEGEQQQLHATNADTLQPDSPNHIELP